MSEVKRYDLVGDMDGNCNLNEARMELSDDGVYVKHNDYAALEAKCAALAAENAWMKAGILQASEDMEAHHDDHGLFSYDADGEQMDALLRLCDAQDSIASLENAKTPATDASLTEVRAQGVDMARNAMIDFVDGEVGPNKNVHGLIRGAEICVSIAEQLRKGVDKK